MNAAPRARIHLRGDLRDTIFQVGSNFRPRDFYAPLPPALLRGDSRSKRLRCTLKYGRAREIGRKVPRHSPFLFREVESRVTTRTRTLILESPGRSRYLRRSSPAPLPLPLPLRWIVRLFTFVAYR